MKRGVAISLIMFAFFVGRSQTRQAIEQWQAYVAFGHGIQVDQSGNNVLYASKYGLSIYDPVAKDYEIRTKAQGLSDLTILFVRKDPGSLKTLVVYDNGNMDLLNGDQTYNIPDFFLKQTTSSKHIYDALWIGSEIYLSTSLGIVVVNTAKNEIKDTYKIPDNSLFLEVLDVALQNGYLYAATNKGVQKALFNSTSLSNPAQWSWEPSMSTVSSPIKNLVSWNEALLATRNDSVFIKNGQTWSFMFASPLPILSLRVSNNKLLVLCGNDLVGKIFSFQSSNSTPQSIVFSSETFAVDAIDVNGTYWIADKNKGLLQVSNGVESNYTPNAPVGISAGQTIFQQGKLLSTSGGVDAAGLTLNNSDGIYVFDVNGWKIYNARNTPALSTFTDALSIAVDPVTNKIYVGSYGKGIASISTDGKVARFTSNSFLSNALNSPSTYNITGLAFDQSQNLWILCDGASQGLCVLKKDGSFKKFSIPYTYTDLRLSKILIDESQKIWIVSSRGNGLFCFDHGGTIDQINDDKWRYFRSGSGAGNLPSSNVNCVAADRNGFLWVGTDKGIGIIQCGEDVFAAICQATIPIVQQDFYAGTLFGEENVLDIEVDGANRKWIATEKGVWLISADGQKVINKFTSENSPLLDNHVHEISINPQSGEVFFMTAFGICSYRGTATEPVTEKKQPIVFPNPVPPGYNGSIAIKGLPENAWVKITELNGKLVHQTKSLGGQAIWNGKNYKGEKVSSGVYLVIVSDEFNTYQVSTKIFFIK